MDKGKILTQGSANELIQRYCPHLTLRLPLSLETHLLKRATRHLAQNPNDATDLHQWQTHNTHRSFKTNTLDASLKALLANDIDLSQLQVHTPTLEDVFLELTGRSLRE
jgi:ABC-type multidrug transport system ATPase subunit